MTSDQLLPLIVTAAMVGGVLAGRAIARHRATKARKASETHAGFLEWLERMHAAGEAQEADPRVAAIVARFEYSVNGGTQPGTRTGRHRAVATGGRHRAVATASA